MLVDTTVWVDHLRRGDSVLVGLLEHSQVAVHPFVVGELSCGHIRHRPALLTALGRLPTVPVLEHDDVLAFLETNKLAGRGLGWIDVHLLASAATAGEKLLTRDRRLRGAAETLGLA
jgi:predicted nucleic acid-binding protein